VTDLLARSPTSDRSTCRSTVRRRRTIERCGCDGVWVRVDRGTGQLSPSWRCADRFSRWSCGASSAKGMIGRACKSPRLMCLCVDRFSRTCAGERKIKICSEKSRDNLAELSDVVRYEHQPNRRADSVRYSRSQEACLGGWS
jgi:hypothetical protein